MPSKPSSIEPPRKKLKRKLVRMPDRPRPPKPRLTSTISSQASNQRRKKRPCKTCLRVTTIRLKTSISKNKLASTLLLNRSTVSQPNLNREDKLQKQKNKRLTKHRKMIRQLLMRTFINPNKLSPRNSLKKNNRLLRKTRL